MDTKQVVACFEAERQALALGEGTNHSAARGLAIRRILVRKLDGGRIGVRLLSAAE
jgi:hypothetical protein